MAYRSRLFFVFGYYPTTKCILVLFAFEMIQTGGAVNLVLIQQPIEMAHGGVPIVLIPIHNKDIVLYCAVFLLLESQALRFSVDGEHERDSDDQ
jgi:hypothetical protein